MSVIHWSEIEAFHNVLKSVRKYPELLNGQNVVHYKAKIKLHGTNAGIQIHNDGRVVAQSRTTELSSTNDNMGFAKWVLENEDKWKKISDAVIVFGEWCGPSIQKGVAISQIPKKSFAVFAARYLASDEQELIKDPQLLKNMVDGIPDTYVLPWFEKDIVVDFSKSSEEITKVIEEINEWVSKIDSEDPWVKDTFGVSGTGEGLVFYPCSEEHLGVANFGNLAFKAKGEKHKVVKSASPVQVSAEAAASISQFVEMVLADARLEQGVTLTSPNGTLTFDIKLTGKFVSWILKDVEKETQDELEASGLQWKQVEKAISDRARAWYIAKSKAL